MDNPIIFQILLALVALFFIFLTYMNTKTWRWLHVTVTVLVFVALIPFGVYAALTLKTRAAWIGKHDSLEADVAKERAAAELAIRGPMADVKLEAESVANLRALVGRTILDRGRVWRDGITGAVGGGGIVLQMSPPPDPAAPAAPAPKHNISQNTILFGFALAENPDTIKVPAAYLGEYRVTAVTDTTVTIVPTLPLAGDQTQIASNPQTQWALYEVCPADGHEWLAGMTEQQLTALIPQQATGLPPAQYQKFISQFLRDGGPADENTDPPENIWIEVKFTKPYQIVVDAPSETTLDIESPFDSEGRARIDRLRVADPGKDPGSVSFAENEVAVFDKATAEKLIADGVATLQKRIFRRTLIDFDTKFRLVFARYAELNTRIAALTRDVAQIQAAKDKADQQATLLEEYKTKLNDDLAKVQFELDEVTKYAGALSNRLGEVRAELSQLYASNKQLSKDLAALNAQMTEAIERRVRESTALNR